jgi:glycosyltransferase involved in cell wall biosynthesis
MSISVIITTYNRPDALKQVLLGLAGQTRLPDEAIVADDGSGPATRQTIGAIASALPYRLVHVWQPDEGFRAAAIRNKAIAASMGDHLVCLDGDCIPDRHFIADHLALAEPGSFFQGKRVLVERDLAATFTHEDVGRRRRLCKWALGGHLGNSWHLVRLPRFPAFYSRRLTGIRSCNMSFARRDIEAVNGFNEQFEGWGREDSELALRLFQLGLKKKTHPFMAVCYHLWHRQWPRDHLAVNDDRLREAVARGAFFCPKGLNTHLGIVSTPLNDK